MVKKAKNKPIHKIKSDRLKTTLLAIPFVLLVFFMCYVPLMGWSLSFFRYKPGFKFTQLEFVGLKYIKLIFDYWKDSFNALTNTMVMGALYIIMMPLPMIFAILLSECRSRIMKKFVQTASSLPHFVSWVIVYALSFALFSNQGLITKLLTSLTENKQAVTVLANKDFAWFFMGLLHLWKTMGWNSIVYLAAIAGIDSSMYEAAALDGANRYHMVRHITIPSIMPTFVVLLLLQVGKFLNVGFDQYFAFTNAAVATKLEVIDLYSYRLAIGNGDYSFGVAVSMLKSVVSIALLYTVNWIAKKVRGESII